MLQDKIAEIIANLDNTIELSIAESTIEIYSKVQERIFNKGLAKDETKIGTYAESTLKRKKRKGKKDSSFVNLTDTTSLRKSIKPRENKIEFSNDYGKKVSGYNEENFGKRIFAPTNDEKQIFINNLEDKINELWK